MKVAPGYFELHCRTNFSFLEGASHASELVEQAQKLGYRGVAITDRNTLAGVVRAHSASRELNSFPIVIGAEITPIDALPVVLWATDRAAYGRLCRLITAGRRRAAKGEAKIYFADIAEHAEGLLAGVLPEAIPFSLPEGAPAAMARGLERLVPNEAELHRYGDLFGDRAYLLFELFYGPQDERYGAEMTKMSKRTRLPLLAAGGVLYHATSRLPLQDVLTATRWRMTVDAARPFLQVNAERHLQPLEAIARKFSAWPDAVTRTLEVAGRCHFSLSELRYEYPEELAPDGKTPMEYLRDLTAKGAAKRFPSGIPGRIQELINHELSLIDEMRYEAYFITVWDIVRFARDRGILCQGRGSACNSVVLYCLEVSSVDPDRINVLFERFISKSRNEAPDIDIDFEHERREEVLQYLYTKYGRERAGLAAVVITYRIRSAIRDVGRALGMSLDLIDAISKQVDGYYEDEQLAQRCRAAGLEPNSQLGKRFLHLAQELVGMPRHLSQHVGGMVITRGPLCELSPIENAAMADRTTIQWDKDDLDELGILKVDCLCLGMLTAIRKAFAMLKDHRNVEYTLANVPAEDPRVYEMLSRADTLGVFQIESRAQMSMLPRLKPNCFFDLVIEVAIVRPGPIQGQMVHPYLRRRNGEEEAWYPNDEVKKVLEKTLGVPLFQEQAMQLAVVAAGFSYEEADRLRRAMAAWRRKGEIDQFQRRLIDGMLEKGMPREFAERVFAQIRGFGEYGFPQSHAAAFALLVYVSAWLKCYEPAAFAAGLLNAQPMGFYGPAQIISDVKNHGVEVRPIDVNHSDWDCTLESTSPRTRFPTATASFALRLGLRLISGMPTAAAETIVNCRHRKHFSSLDDFTRRTKLGQALLKRLSAADAFGSLGADRRQLLWQSLGQEKQARNMPLFNEPEENEPLVELPKLSEQAEVYADYRTTGLSLKGHPIGFHREALSQLRVLRASDLATAENERVIKVAGIVLIRQRPATAKGITFVTLEDETGVANLIVRPEVWNRFYTICKTTAAWIATGKLERHSGVINILTFRIDDLTLRIGELKTKSRDFR